MRVSIRGLRDRLLLPGDAKIVAAGTVSRYSAAVNPEADELALTVDLPGAPEGAVTAEVIYTHSGHRDPVEFKRLAWRDADGAEIEAEAGRPEAEPPRSLLPPSFMDDVREETFRSEDVEAVRLTHLPTGVTAEGRTRDEAVVKLSRELTARGDICINDARAVHGFPPFAGDFANERRNGPAG
jgi:hypothetical protein